MGKEVLFWNEAEEGREGDFKKEYREREQEKKEGIRGSKMQSIITAEAGGHGTKIKQSRKVRGVITKRDRTACRWICEQGVMNVDQLWRAVWRTADVVSPRYTYTRVQLLEQSGIIQRIRTPYSLKMFYKATAWAQELASEGGDGERLVPLHSPPINEIAHADGLTELRLMVDQAQPSALWQSDRSLAIDASFPKERFYGHLPDAIWTTPKGHRIAVEYERTRKTVSRLRRKIETFSAEIARPDRVFERVLWIGVTSTKACLTQCLENRPEQTLRTMEEFFRELQKL